MVRTKYHRARVGAEHRLAFGKNAAVAPGKWNPGHCRGCGTDKNVRIRRMKRETYTEIGLYCEGC